MIKRFCHIPQASSYYGLLQVKGEGWAVISLVSAHSRQFSYWILENQDHLLMSEVQPENSEEAVIDSAAGRSSKLDYYRDDCMAPPMAKRKHYKPSGKS